MPSVPAAMVGSEEVRARFFWRIYRELENRIKLFTSLRLDDLDSFSLQRRLDEIGKTGLEVDP